jgi:hypothetical protein
LITIVPEGTVGEYQPRNAVSFKQQQDSEECILGSSMKLTVQIKSSASKKFNEKVSYGEK